jgi:hypothetical protein
MSRKYKRLFGFCFYAKGIPLGEFIMMYFMSNQGIPPKRDNDEMAKKTRNKTEG